MATSKDIHELITHVEEFHDAFGIGNNHAPTVKIEKKDIQLRFDLMKEENEEYLLAAENGDLIEVADAFNAALNSGDRLPPSTLKPPVSLNGFSTE